MVECILLLQKDFGIMEAYRWDIFIFGAIIFLCITYNLRNNIFFAFLCIRI
jgi:hypothetical protein